MENGKFFLRSQFMQYFGELQRFLREDVPTKDGFFLTSVTISDIAEHDEVMVQFEGVYGPVAMCSSDNVNVWLSDFAFWFVYGKDGSFKDWSGDVPMVKVDLTPRCCPYPSSDYFPHWKSLLEDGCETLIEVVLRLLEKLKSFKFPLHSITFSTSDIEYDYKFCPGCKPTFDSPGEEPELLCTVWGTSLVEDLLDGFQYRYLLQKSKKVAGEYELRLSVSDPKARVRSLRMAADYWN